MAEFAKPASPRYAFGDFVLERAQQEVRRRDGSPLNLSPRLFNALLATYRLIRLSDDPNNFVFGIQ